MKKLIMTVVALMGATALFAQTDVVATFQQATANAKAGNFTEAIAQFESVIEAGWDIDEPDANQLKAIAGAKKFVVTCHNKMGIAAINAGGMTIHSFFGFEPKVLTPYDKASLNNERYAILRDADTIIIDEVSMVRCDLIDAMNRALQKCMKNFLPFGGKQMLFVGDMFQLEPVVNADDKEEMKALYGDRKPFFFNADVFSHITIVL